MIRKFNFLLVFLLIAFINCEGPEGPVGPAGTI